MATINKQLIEYAQSVVQSGLFEAFVVAKVQNLGERMVAIPHEDETAVVKAQRELHYFMEFAQFIQELSNDEAIQAYLNGEELEDNNMVLN